MSDSSLSRDVPDEETLETELRQVVHRIYSTGNHENLTVKRVRSLAENNLSLEDGFFKGSKWKARSEAVIKTEAERADKSSADESSPVQPKKIPKKRGSSDSPQPAKRRRKSVDVVEDNDAGDSAPKQSQAKRSQPQKKPKVKKADARSATPDEPPIDRLEKQEDVEEGTAKTAMSESELSELLDDEPKPKPKKKKASSQEPKVVPKEPKKRGRKSKDKAPDLDPDAAEIKRLQGWLIKCGIRKMWARELKPYDTAKAKIRHLREMLSDAGMTGRYSVEKASQIREARELQADLEAVTAQEKRWGRGNEEEEEARPPRRLAKGLEGLDFSDSDSD